MCNIPLPKAAGQYGPSEPEVVWRCTHPDCRTIYAEYVNGCPRCYKREGLVVPVECWRPTLYELIAADIAKGNRIMALKEDVQARQRSFDVAAGLAEARLQRLAKMDTVLRRLMEEPYGCRFCDSGKLRNPGNPAKGHDDTCAWQMAAELGYVQTRELICRCGHKKGEHDSFHACTRVGCACRDFIRTDKEVHRD